MSKQKYIINVKVEVSSRQTLQFEVEGESKEAAVKNFFDNDPRRDLIKAVDVKYPTQVWEEIQDSQLSRWAGEDFGDVDVQASVIDVEEVSTSIAEIRTKSGYTFYILENGKVVDAVESKDRTITWPDLQSFRSALNLYAKAS